MDINNGRCVSVECQTDCYNLTMFILTLKCCMKTSEGS